MNKFSLLHCLFTFKDNLIGSYPNYLSINFTNFDTIFIVFKVIAIATTPSIKKLKLINAIVQHKGKNLTFPLESN